MTPTEFGQFDFSSPDIPGEEPSAASSPKFDFSSPDAPDGDQSQSFLSFETLIGHLKPITSKPSDSFNWFMGSAAKVGEKVGWLQEQAAELGGAAAKNLIPGDSEDEFVDTIFGAQAALSSKIQTRSRDSANYWLDKVSEEFRTQAEAGLDDPEFGVTTLYAAALGSLPEMMLTMGSGALAGKLTQMAGTVGFARIAAAAEAGSPLASKMLSYAKYAPVIAGAAVGGMAEGSLAAGATGVAMEERVNAMTHEELIESSDRYRDIYDSAFGMSEEARRAYAKGTVGEELARTTASWVGLSTAALGAPTGAVAGYLGGRAAGAAAMGGLVKKLEGTVTGQAAAGFAGEGAQEFLQEGSQQFLTNLGLREYVNPKQALSEGVLDNAVIGGLVGGIMGGTMTPLVGGGARAQAKGEAAAGEAGGLAPEAKFSRNPILEARIVEQIKGLEAAGVPASEFQQVARWAGQTAAGGRSALEFSKALEELLETGKAPEHVASMVGEDFDEDGMLTEAAYVKDSTRLDFAVEMHIKPANDEELAKVVDALAAGGANPYRMKDGTLVVPQSEPGRAGLEAVAKSITRQTGAAAEIVTREVNQNTEGAEAADTEATVSAEAAVATEGAEGVLKEEDIVNPIPRDGTPEQKLEAIHKLTEENKPLVDSFLASMDAEIGTKSLSNVKKDDAILGKATRPSILRDKPWHNIEHLRDTFRFKSTVETPQQIEQIAEKIKEQGWEIVKVDTDKFAKPKEWGWRFVALDLRMPNGQLVEYYVPFREMDEVKEAVGHKLFEKWRNRDLKSLNEEQLREYEADLNTSNANYTQAFQASLARSGASESDAFASAAKFAATFASSTGPSTSMKSSAEKSKPADQTPSRREAAKPSSSTATSDKSSDADTRISSSSAELKVGEETVAQVDAPRKHVTVKDAAGLEAMGLTAAAHPGNDIAEPTERQLRAGNYPKGHGTLKGAEAREDIPVSIENVPGSIRRGLDAKWSRKMKHWYGYIRGTKHVGDGKLDVYMGKRAHDNSLPVFVVHQNKPDGTFDEPKVLLGYKTDGEAKAAYLSEYPANLGAKLFGGITRLSRTQFADYIESGRTDVPPNPMTKKPMVDLRPAQFSVAMAEAKGTTDKPVKLTDFYTDPRKAFTAPGWAVLTATRESAGDFGSVANLEANRDLEKNLRDRGIRFVAVKGSYQGVDQGKNYLIIANERTAIELGAIYGQESVLTNRGLVYMDGRLTPAVHGDDIVGPSAKKEDFFSVLPSGTAFSLGLNFDETGTDPQPRVADEETVASVTYKGKRKAEARAAEDEARARTPGVLSLRKDEATSRARTTYDDAVKIVERTVAGLKGAPDVIVHTGESDLPTHLHNQIIEHGAQGLVEGMYDPMDGKVHIIPRNVQLREGETFSDAVQRILMEESLGHFGLDAVFGQRALDKLHDIVWADAKATPRMKAIVKSYSNVYGDITDKSVQRRMANEYLAKFGEEDRPTLWQKVVAWFRDAIRGMGVSREWTDDDLKVLMDRVFNAVRTGHVPTSLKKLNTALLQQDGDAGLTTFVKDGKVMRRVEFDGPTRRITAEGYRATMQDGMESGMPAADVTSFSGSLRDFAEFVAEEGKRVIVAPESVITEEMAEGFDTRVDEGARIVQIPDELVNVSRKATEAQFSLRNRAKGDDDIEAILAKTVQPHTGEMTWGQRMNQWFREVTGILGETDTYLELKTGWIDSAAAIERLERGQFDGKLLDASESAYKMVSLTKNLPQVAAAWFKAGVPAFKDGSFVRVPGRKGPMEIFAPLFKTADGKNLLHLWEGYAVARRSSQLINQTNPDGTSKEKLLTHQEIEKLLSLEREYPVFRKVFDEWQVFNHQALDLAVERGAMDEATAELWKKNDYVPFFRVDDADEEVTAGISRKRGLSGQRVTSKRLTGSDKRIQPVLENIILNSISIIDKIYKNEAMNRIVALADGVAMTKEPLRAEAIRMTNEDLARALKKAGLFVGDDSNSTPLQRKAGKLLRDNDIDYAVRAVENMTPEQREAWTTLFRRVRPEGKDVVSVMVGGKPVYYRVHDPLLLRAIMDMTPVNFGALVNFMGGAKRLLTTMVTLDPGFMAANWMRDTLSSWVVVDEKFKPFADAPKSAAEIWTESGLATDLAIAGGMTGGFYDPTQDFADVVSEFTDPGVTVLNSPKKLLDAYRKVGMVSEQVNRMAIAKAVLRRGGSMAEAAYQAQDVLNFSQSGDAVAAQLLIRTVPFLNARIQGLYRLWKGARGLDGRDPMKAKLAFVLKGIFLAGISMLLSIRNLNDERYEKLPDFQKDTYWHFFVGDSHYAIPKPFEVGVLFATLPERAMRFAMGNDSGRTTAHSIGRALGDTFAFNPVPQLFKPIVEQWANRSFFTDRPIVGMELEGLEPVAQYNPWTSETARALTSGLDQVVPDGMGRFLPETLRSPTRLEHAMRAYLGTVGGYILQLSDAAMRGVGAFPDAPAMASVRDIPVVGGAAGRFVRGDPELQGASKYADDLYDALAKADDAYRTLNAYIRQGNLAAAEELADRRLTELSVRPILHDFREAAAELNTQQRFIMQSDLPPEEKRQALDDITRAKNEVMKESIPYLAMLGY